MDSRHVCEVCGEQKCCSTESPGEVVVRGEGRREIMNSTKSHKRKVLTQWTICLFAGRTHTFCLASLVWPTSSNRHTKRKQFCTLPNSLVWDLLFDLVWGFLFYFLNGP